MKKTFSHWVFFAILFIFLSLTGEANGLSNPVTLNQPLTKSKVELFNLIVSCLSSPSQPPGGSLMYSVRLMNLSGPVANAEVKINDPIGRVCTSVKTNLDGTVLWIKQIPFDAKSKLYVFEFFYQNSQQFSKVAVSLISDAIKIPSYSFDLNISKILDAQSLVIASRGGFSPDLQTTDALLNEGAKFGVAVAKDFWKNPFNKSIVILGGISCIAAPGNPVCIAAVSISLKEIIKSEVKVFGYNIIDATVKSKEEKDFFKNMLDLSTIAISVARLKPGEGLTDLDALSAGYEFIENEYKQYIYIEGKLKGASFSAQIKGSNEVYLFSLYNRDLSNPIAEQTYKTVKIGNQVWMAKNLNESTYRNGDIIPQVKDALEWSELTTGAWCYYDNDPENGKKYGKLYNWYAIYDSRGLAPKDFHIPTDEEWATLTNNLGYFVAAGGKLKEAGFEHWLSPNKAANNSCGFTGLPAGIRNDDGSFQQINKAGYWWSSSTWVSHFAWSHYLQYDYHYISNHYFDMAKGFSVRCVRD